jgi:hypothetical protein
LQGACLNIVHTYCLRCVRRKADIPDILKSTKEIDLCAALGNYFGPSSHLHAQGSSKADLLTDSPPFEVEVKYLLPNRTSWKEVSKDWTWLRKWTSDGGTFRRRALVWFWPSIDLYDFGDCLKVTRQLRSAYSEAGIAAFWPFTNVFPPPPGNKQRLEFAEPRHLGPHAVKLPGGKRIRIDIVGSVHHPLWAVIYTRLIPTEFDALPEADRHELRQVAFDVNLWPVR